MEWETFARQIDPTLSREIDDVRRTERLEAQEANMALRGALEDYTDLMGQHNPDLGDETIAFLAPAKPPRARVLYDEIENLPLFTALSRPRLNLNRIAFPARSAQHLRSSLLEAMHNPALDTRDLERLSRPGMISAIAGRSIIHFTLASSPLQSFPQVRKDRAAHIIENCGFSTRDKFWPLKYRAGVSLLALRGYLSQNLGLDEEADKLIDFMRMRSDIIAPRDSLFAVFNSAPGLDDLAFTLETMPPFE